DGGGAAGASPRLGAAALQRPAGLLPPGTYRPAPLVLPPGTAAVDGTRRGATAPAGGREGGGRAGSGRGRGARGGGRRMSGQPEDRGRLIPVEPARCPTCGHPAGAVMPGAPCADIWHDGGGLAVKAPCLDPNGGG